MFLQTELERVYNALCECESLEECSVIKAYPYVKKPTVLTTAVITVSPAHADLKNVTLGGQSAYGTYGFNVDVFVPQKDGSPCESGAVEGVIEAVSALEPVRIKVSDFSAKDVLNAFFARCLIEFSGAVDVSGEELNG